MIEATTNILAAIIIGIVNGHIMKEVSNSLMTTFWEAKQYTIYDWRIMVVLFGIGVITTYVGTKISIGVINRKKISSILKGD